MSFPFNLEVLVYIHPNLRDDGLEMEAYLGRSVLDSLFDHMEDRPDVTTLVLSFPERWLNILEQRALLNRLRYFCPNLKEVQIKTHSVYIIQCTPNKNVRIITHKDKTLGTELAGHLYDPKDVEVCRYLFADRLNVIGGSVKTKPIDTWGKGEANESSNPTNAEDACAEKST